MTSSPPYLRPRAPSIVSGVRLRCASKSVRCGCAQSAISWGRASRSLPSGDRAQNVNLATHREPVLETRHHPGQSVSLDTNQQMRCAYRIAGFMANYASNDEHYMVVSVCACTTDWTSPVGATNSERASSAPRVWYDDIFAQCSSGTTVDARVSVKLPGSSVIRHFFLWKSRHTSSVNELMHG